MTLASKNRANGPVLVTGASGFVGAAIVSQLQAAGFSVRETGRSRQNRRHYITADLLDRSTLPALVEGTPAVIHTAGLAHQFSAGAESQAAFEASNVTATKNLLQVAIAASVVHVVLISSVAVYGSYLGNQCTEATPCRPVGPYAESKYRAEQEAMALATHHGLSLTILRLATVYGEGDPGNIARLMRSIDRNRFIWVGQGTNWKSLIHKDDVGRACTAVLTSDHCPGDIHIYNVAAAPVTMRQVVQQLAHCLEKQLPPVYIPARAAQTLSQIAASTSRLDRFRRLNLTIHKWLTNDVYPADKFNAAYRFQPSIDLSQGIHREVTWYRGGITNMNHVECGMVKET